jgi:hypothetical protein
MNFRLGIGKAIVIGLSLASVLVGSVASAQYIIDPSLRTDFDQRMLDSIERERMMRNLEGESGNQWGQETQQERCARLHNCDTSKTWCRQYRAMAGCQETQRQETRSRETQQERCARLHNCDTSSTWCRQYRAMVGCSEY